MQEFRDDLFQAELVKAIGRSFKELRRRLVGERLYGYSLYINPSGSYVGSYGNSEEGLTREVQNYLKKGRYKAKSGDLATHLAAILRWNCEDGWLELDEPHFANANLLLRTIYESDPDAFYDHGYTRLVYLMCLVALAEVDAKGGFGRGDERASITLNLYLGDQSDEMLLGWAEQVNPNDVYERFQSELAAEDAADEQLIYDPPNRKR